MAQPIRLRPDDTITSIFAQGTTGTVPGFVALLVCEKCGFSTTSIAIWNAGHVCPPPNPIDVEVVEPPRRLPGKE